MIRRQASFSLSKNTPDLDHDVNPLESIPNLVDVMLVFAVALMISLISFWQVDLPSAAESTNSEKVKQVEADLTQSGEESVLEGEKYEDLGRVYKDVTTGELYMVQE